jgi:Bax protein
MMEDNTNNVSLTTVDNDVVTFGNTTVEKWKVLLGMVSLITSIVIGMTLLLIQPAAVSPDTQDQSMTITSAVSKQDKGKVHIATNRELLQTLKELKLWEVEPVAAVPPVIFTAFPKNFNDLEDITSRKRAFLHILLPAALIALNEVQQERARLLAVLNKIGTSPENLSFSDNGDTWRSYLAKADIDFVQMLMQKYRTADADELLNRVAGVPVSLVLGQGAIESSWGGSRFALTGNNIFGIWTWGENGMIPAQRDEGKNHKVKIYDSILDSVRSYILTLNRLGAYRHLRELRQQSNDSLELAEGLLFYSERRDAYVEDVRRVISSNNLKRYDKISLARTKWWPVLSLNTFSFRKQNPL